MVAETAGEGAGRRGNGGGEGNHSGAFVLWLGTRHFQPDIVHVSVVDPGVGTERRPIAFALNGSFYVGPDNGLFDMVIQGRAATCNRQP